MSSSTSVYRAERTALRLMEHFNSWRFLIGLGVVGVLTWISLTFNYSMGHIADPENMSGGRLAWGYAMLDVCLLFLVVMLSVGIRAPLLHFTAYLWAGVLVALSLWACLSFVLAIDAGTSKSNKKLALQAALSNYRQAKSAVDTAQRKYEGTTNHTSKFQKQLMEATAKREEAYKQLLQAQKDNSPVSFAVFEKASSIVGGDGTPALFQLIIRLFWGAALVISPLLCMSIVASELNRSLRNAPKRPAPIPRKVEKESIQEHAGASKQNKPEGAARSRKQRTPAPIVVVDERRYQKLLKKVLAEEVPPTTRAVKECGLKIGSESAGEYLRRMAKEGYIVRLANGYRLATRIKAA